MSRRTLLPLVLAAAAFAADPVPQTELTVTAGSLFSYRPAFNGQPLDYRGENLPAGVAVDPATGLLRGKPLQTGVFDGSIIARGATSQARLRFRLTVLPGSATIAAVADTPATSGTAPGSEPAPGGAPPAYAGGEEEDEADPMLAAGGAKLSEWTDNQRRVIHHWFLPGAATLPGGDWYYRISHVARNGYDEDVRTNLLGLDDNVKIGFMVGWSPVETTTLTVQRINGRDLAVAAPAVGEKVSYDTYEFLGTWQLLDQRGVRGLWSGPCDLSLVAGWSWMLRNHGTGDVSLDLGVVAERDLFNDRLRLGVGLFHAGLSAYDQGLATGPSDKLFPDEQDYLVSQGTTVKPTANGTSSLALTARVALSQHWFLMGEGIVPLSGWDTEEGPAYAAGLGYDTNTHEFAIYFSNTANAAFNSVLTGGAQPMALPFFAFSITAYL
ncbi:MAG TPA: hypothetical protein DCS97_04750 [Planctomycetes bacterium]|nr:hypothetical protein [Planctomycetota bacterium]